MLSFLCQAQGAVPVGDSLSETGGFLAKVLEFLKDRGPDVAVQIVMAIVILIVGRMVAGALRGGLKKVMTSQGVDPSLTGFLASLVYFAVMAFTVVAVIGRFGVETASFVAILGAAGFAVGMALQGTLANFASGVMILLFRPFKTGDVIEAAGVLGAVKDIRIFSTTIATPDNIRITVPNGQLYGGVIKNYNGYENRRVDMVMGVSYEADLNQAMTIMNDLLNKDERVLKDPSPTVAVSELADSSVNFVVRPWVNAADYWAVMFDFHKNCKEAFDAAGIEIPFPQTVVHLNKTEA